MGVLIGETGDLRQRIKQYVSGTQERGNKLWRETFLLRGDVRLYTLDFAGLSIDGGNGSQLIAARDALTSNNFRLVLEQLLVAQAVAEAADTAIWVVNARK